ncbi:MAG: hypothetical protein KC619_02345 [Myxococcales bacterium]|nr:hypothetical protein [Myxococcales bacterium]
MKPRITWALAMLVSGWTVGAAAQSEEPEVAGDPGAPENTEAEVEEDSSQMPPSGSTTSVSTPGDETPPSADSASGGASAPPEQDVVLDFADSTMSAARPGMAPELAPPTFDIVAANITVSTVGATITGSITPFRFLRSEVPFLSQASIQLRADSGARTWGGGLTLGHNASRYSLRDVRPCVERHRDAMVALERRVRRVLADQGAAPRAVVSPDDPRLSQILVAMISQVSDPTTKGELRAIYARSQRRRTTCLVEGYREYSVLRAFDSGAAITLTGNANFFAFVDEPAVDPDPTMPMSAPSDPTAEFVRDYSFNLSGAFFFSRDTAVWLSASFSRRRPDAATVQMDSRFGVGLTFAQLLPIAPSREDGFRPGVAFGVAGTYSVCVEDEGEAGASCREKLDGYPSPLRVSDLGQIIPFVDLRFDTKLQLRIGVTIDVMVLDRAVAGTGAEAGDQVWRVVPTLSTTTSAWGF